MAKKKEAPAPKVKKMTQEQWDALSTAEQRSTPYAMRPRIRPEVLGPSFTAKQLADMKQIAEGARTISAQTIPQDVAAPSEKKEKAAGTKKARMAAPSIEEIDPALAVKIKKHFDKNTKGGTCAALRAVGAEFPDVHHRVIAAALPELNPSTVSIQVKKGRA